MSKYYEKDGKLYEEGAGFFGGDREVGSVESDHMGGSWVSENDLFDTVRNYDHNPFSGDTSATINGEDESIEKR